MTIIVASGVISLGSIPDSYASTIGYTATVAGLGILADAWNGGRIDDGWARLLRFLAPITIPGALRIKLS